MYVDPELVYLIVGMAFVAGLLFGWGVFEARSVSRLIRQERAATQLDRPTRIEPPKDLPRLPRLPRADRHWSRADEDWLLVNAFDTSLATEPEPRKEP